MLRINPSSGSLGILIDIHNQEEPHLVFGDLINNCSDTPASCKFAGLAGHSQPDNPCRWCHIKLVDVSTANGYQRKGELTV